MHQEIEEKLQSYTAAVIASMADGSLDHLFEFAEPDFSMLLRQNCRFAEGHEGICRLVEQNAESFAGMDHVTMHDCSVIGEFYLVKGTYDCKSGEKIHTERNGLSAIWCSCDERPRLLHLSLGPVS